jgi:hypothetical protein
VLELLQAVPSAMQLPLKQQPLLHVLPGQHGPPGVPHSAHKDEVVLQTEPAAQRSVPLVPGQHVSPGSPQDEQTLLRQERPAPQVVPQQGWPEAPHPEHFPAAHTPPPVPPVPPIPVVLPQVVDSATHCSL